MVYTTPSGFRDVLAAEAELRERVTRAVQDKLAAYGYVPIETPTLERMAVMQVGGRLPESPFKFFDATGELVTMRPDVTLQVARMGATRLRDEEGPLRFRYMQRVFRESEGQLRADVRERTQMGVECIGEAGVRTDAEIVGLFARVLETAGVRDFKLSLATVDVLRSLVARSGASDQWKEDVLAAFHASNLVSIDRLCTSGEAGEGQPEGAYASAIRELARIRGGRDAIEKAREIAEPLGCAEGIDAFEQTYDLLAETGLAEHIVIDFSVVSSFDYYTGIVFEAFAPGLGVSLGSGGRYDNMLGAYGKSRPAAGFAFYLEEAMAAAQNTRGTSPSSCGLASRSEVRNGSPSRESDAPRELCPDEECGTSPSSCTSAEQPLRIAVPKGSLAADTLRVLGEAGLDVSGLDNPGRALIVHNPGVDYIIVRPSDAPVFVEMGAADCGICGEDSLLETAADVVELVDLKFGSCRFIVAEPEGAADAVAEHYRKLGSIRVATKYPRIAREHFARRGTQVEIVQLHGNIELGPLTGMSECIVDITATGTTLRENNLVITDEVLSSTARFFANAVSFRTDARVRALADKLREGAAHSDLKVTAGGAQ